MPLICALWVKTAGGLLTLLTVSSFSTPQDICDGNKKLNTSMVAQLFNTNHGLKFDTEKKRMSMVDISALNIDDAGDSR
jgi:hypothetical protein